jgi:hypothetical protein
MAVLVIEARVPVFGWSRPENFKNQIQGYEDEIPSFHYHTARRCGDCCHVAAG